MAKTWSVTPNDGVTAATDGVYVFPANDTYDDKVYTVTLKDTDCNCVAHKTIKVKGKSAPTACTCSITSDYGTTSSKISGDQHTNVKIGTFTSYLCSGTTTFSYNSGDADFVSNFSYTGNDIYADVSSNVSTTNSRMAIYNASCGGSLTIYQASAEEVCPTQSSDIINTTTTVVYSGGTQVAVMQILKNSTYTAYTITADSTSSSYVSNINEGAQLHDDWYVVLADVTANPNTSDRSLYFDVVVEGPTLGSGCTYNGVTVTQNGACEIASANCTKWQNYNLPATGASDYPVAIVGYCNGYTAFTEAFATSYSFVRNIRETSETGGPCILDGRIIVVDLDANTSTSTRDFTINFTGRTSDGKSCTQSLTWTQDGASTPPTPGACDNLGLTATTADVGSGVGIVSVGTISGSHTISAGTGTPSWITVKKGIGDPAPVSLTIQQNTSTSARTGTVTFNVDGTDCDGKTVSVSQSGSTSTAIPYKISTCGQNHDHCVNWTTDLTFGLVPAPNQWRAVSSVFGATDVQQQNEFSWSDPTAGKATHILLSRSHSDSNAKYVTIIRGVTSTEKATLLNRGTIPETSGVIQLDTAYNFNDPCLTLYIYFENA